MASAISSKIAEGFENEKVNPAFEQPRDLFLKSSEYFVAGRMPERLQCAARRSDRTRDEHRFPNYFPGTPCDPRSRVVDVADPALQGKRSEPKSIRTERVRFDYFSTGHDIVPVDLLDEVRPLQVLSVEAAIAAHPALMKLRAERSVGQDHVAVLQSCPEGMFHCYTTALMRDSRESDSNAARVRVKRQKASSTTARICAHSPEASDRSPAPRACPVTSRFDWPALSCPGTERRDVP